MNAFKHLDPKHLEDIKEVIEEYFVVPLSPYSSSDLEIVITGHDTFKGQYKIGDSESSKKAWKELFETLQRRLLHRLKSAQSFCSRFPGDVLAMCEFCKRNHALKRRVRI